MTETEAMGLLNKVCRAYVGNANEHDLLKQALQVVQGGLNTTAPEPEAVEKSGLKEDEN